MGEANERWRLLVITLALAGCRSPAPPPSIDAGPAVSAVTEATPFLWPLLLRARCAIPDGGADVTTFDALLSPDCERAPLSCATEAARARVLQQADAGTLAFPTPRHRMKTDALGWFEVPVELGGVVMVTCADARLFHTASRNDFEFADPTRELRPWSGRHDDSLAHVPDAGSFFVINPWTRRSAVLSREEYAVRPPELDFGHWATPLDAVLVTRAAGDFQFSDGLERRSAGLAQMFEPPTPLPPPEHPVTVTVRATLPPGLLQRNLSLTLRELDGGVAKHVDSRLSRHAFRVEAGRYLALVEMDGARSVELPVDASRDTEVVAALEPGIGQRGRVVDVHGKPVPCASIFSGGELVTWADVHGEFALRASPVSLRAWHPSLGGSPEVKPTTPDVTTLTLTPRADVRVQLEAPDGGAVWGSARLGDERTPASRFALIRNSELELNGLEPGARVVTVLTRDWRAAKLQLTVGDQPLRLVQRLEEKPALTGTVLRDGKPVPHVLVRFERPDAVWDFHEDETFTDDQGRFRLTRSLPGPAWISADGQRQRKQVPVPATGVQLRLER